MVPKLFNPTSIYPVCNLGAVATVSSGGTPSRNRPEYWTGDVPWITTSNIDFGIITEPSDFISHDGLKNSSARLCPSGSILMAMYGQGATRGRVGILGIDAAINQACAVIYPNNNVNQMYLYHYLAHHYPSIRMLSQGGSQSNLSGELLKQIPVVLPGLSTQSTIATILSIWDRAIEQVSKLIDAKTRLKKGLMQQLLTGKRRFPGFKEANGPKPGKTAVDPNGWPVKRLEECCDILDNLRVPLNESQRNEMPGEIPYYGANGVLDYVDDYLFNEPIILIAEDGGYFDEAATRPICQLVTGKSWVNNHAHVIRAKYGMLAEWIYYWFVHRNITPFINSGTRSKLNQADLRRLPIACPPIDEQRRIVDVLTSIDRIIAGLNEHLKKGNNQKRGLMQVLLTGKVRVKLDSTGDRP